MRCASCNDGSIKTTAQLDLTNQEAGLLIVCSNCGRKNILRNIFNNKGKPVLK